ncbi:MAG: hypothetical protein HC933_05715 [Pleurocapsa sp. SU_196_0]|nr:hypothetical protein [Pleurocapsa sp. SU_196_0]
MLISVSPSSFAVSSKAHNAKLERVSQTNLLEANVGLEVTTQILEQKR